MLKKHIMSWPGTVAQWQNSHLISLKCRVQIQPLLLAPRDRKCYVKTDLTKMLKKSWLAAIAQW
jgi:hypothetical protein